MAQILAVVIFAVMFLLIVTEKIERHWVSLGCGLLMLVVVFGFCMHSPAAVWNTLGLQSFASVDLWYQASEGAETASGINWSTILFIAGMMLMVEGMGRAGFFRWLCLQLARLVKYKTIPLFLAFMVMSSVLSMFIDSITVILFLAAATVELSRILRFNPGADDHRGDLLREPGRRGDHVRRSAEHHHRHLAGVFGLRTLSQTPA